MPIAIVMDCETGDAIEIEVSAPSLDDAKAALWSIVKTVRDQHIDGGVSVPGIGTFDSDPLSRSNINGAVTGALVAGQLGQPFEVSWKLADNSIETLDGPAMIAAGMAVMQHVAACHANSQVLGTAIMAAPDGAALDAINIGVGWP